MILTRESLPDQQEDARLREDGTLTMTRPRRLTPETWVHGIAPAVYRASLTCSMTIWARGLT
jgi:hypothetical protein